jgi:3,4-dihydroxy 2-butanone 4-phosphate synthase/GTP cyclohydrolase II
LVEDIKAGKMVLLVDDEDRENEGDLVLAGEYATAEHINFMVKEARGLVCLAMSPEQSDRLGLSLMVGEGQNHSPNKTAFTVSIEAREGISTGISASDRALTIRVASDPEATPQSIITPGHIFPIKAKPGGVLQRSGHTEGSVDLMKLAGLQPSAVICEVMNDDGTMARYPQLKNFAEKHGLKIGSIEALTEYRLKNESHIEELHVEDFEIEGAADLKAHYFRDLINDQVHYAIVSGEWKNNEIVPIRVHVDRGPDDLLHGENQAALRNFLKFTKEKGKGVLLVLRHAKSFARPDAKRDFKEFGVGAQILKKLGAENLALVTNSQKNLTGLTAFGVQIKEMISFEQFFKNGGEK